MACHLFSAKPLTKSVTIYVTRILEDEPLVKSQQTGKIKENAFESAMSKMVAIFVQASICL